MVCTNKTDQENYEKMNRHSKLPDKHKAHDKCSDSGELRTNNTTTHCTSESKEGNERIKNIKHAI